MVLVQVQVQVRVVSKIQVGCFAWKERRGVPDRFNALASAPSPAGQL
jgi:hypothetical protein